MNRSIPKKSRRGRHGYNHSTLKRRACCQKTGVSVYSNESTFGTFANVGWNAKVATYPVPVTLYYTFNIIRWLFGLRLYHIRCVGPGNLERQKFNTMRPHPMRVQTVYSLATAVKHKYRTKLTFFGHLLLLNLVLAAESQFHLSLEL